MTTFQSTDPAHDFSSLALRAEKNESGKTVFNLRPDTIAHIQKAAKGAMISMKEVLDIMAKKIAEKSRDNKNPLPIATLEGEKVRKSFTISEKARGIFNELAKKYGVPRDTILETAVEILKNPYEGIQLSCEEKVLNARILSKMVREMLAIYYKPSYQEALQKLIHSEDPDFGDMQQFDSCGDLFESVSKLDYLPSALEDFIRQKEEEDQENSESE